MAQQSPRRLSAQEAIALIQPDDQVSLGQLEAEALIQALLADRERLRGVRLISAPVLGKASYAAEEVLDDLRVTMIYVGPALRHLMASGKIDYIPASQVELFRMVTFGYLRPSVIMLQVAPPDRGGRYSMALSADWNLPAAKSARLVIAQLNTNLPRTRGGAYLTDEDIDVIVEADEPVFESRVPNIGSVEAQIGRNVADLVPNGATLETGIGGIPAAVAQALAGHQDLGIHTATFTDSLRDLYLAGVVTNRYKEVDPDKMVAALVMGTADLYAWLDDNPVIEIQPPPYVHANEKLSQYKTLIALNSAIEVDLTGQVNAEAIGGSVAATVGGGVDFARGAMANPNSKSIIALPSTAGKRSRIVPVIPQGHPVTYARHDIQYIVTEYGAANIRGKSLGQRARLIAELAHPDYRDALRAEAEKFPAG